MTAKQAIHKMLAKQRELKGTLFQPTDVKGVVYGKKQDPINITADRLSLQRIYENLGHSVIFDLEIEGEKSPIPVLLHDVARRPNTNQIIHFDLYAVTKDQKIKTEVPIHFEGEPAAQADSEKVITTILEKVEIEALPADLPESLVLSVVDLAEIGDTKHVSDLVVPDGISVLTESDSAIIKVDELQENVEEEPEQPEAEVAEGEEQAEQDEEAQSSDDKGGNSSD